MRKLFNSLALMAAAAMGVVSCTEVDNSMDYIAPSEGRVISINVASAAPQTKISFEDNGAEGIALEWETGDKVSAYDSDGAYVGDFVCIEKNEDDTYRFGLSLLDGQEFNEGNYTAIYPASTEATLEDAKARDLTSAQDGDSIMNLDAACYMLDEFEYADGAIETIYFEHQMAIMTFQFASTESPATLVFENGDDIYTVNYTEIEPVNDIYTSHIMINPCEADERNLVFSLYTSGATTPYDVREVSSSKAYAAGYRYTASVSDYAKAYELVDGVYQIYSGEGLKVFADLVNSGDENISGKLMNDIVLSGEWTPIGSGTSTDTAYGGTFDGQGYSITGLSITGTSEYQALFGSLYSATIKNLSVGGNVKGGASCAILVGAIYATSTIESCTILEGSSVTGTSNNTAGIVGYSNSKNTITDCVNHADISGTKYVGGIAGYCTPDKVTTISNCSNTGSIYSSGTFAGGIVGKQFGKSGTVSCVANCSNSGVIEAVNQYAGGIIGANQGGIISNCYNLGVAKSNDCAGGLVGIHETYTDIYAAEMYNCYTTAAGAVSTETTNTSIGIVVGKCLGGLMSNCFYDDSLSGDAIAYTTNSQTATPYTTAYMQGEEFVTILNNSAFAYNTTSPTTAACAWKYSTEAYPTLNIGVTPVYTELIASLFDSGDGASEETAYVIANEDQLRKLISDVNTGANGSGYYGIYFKLSNDIILSDVALPTIGYYNEQSGNAAFRGNFDGCGYEISNINLDDDSSQSQGLFGYIQYATIKNLGVSGSVKGTDYVGGLVGYANNSSIISCYSDVEVSGSGKFVGGVVGYLNNSSELVNSYNWGDVESTYAESSAEVGGLVGRVSMNSSVYNCYNAGEVTSDYSERVGSVAGYCDTATITSCYYDSSNYSGDGVGYIYDDSSVDVTAKTNTNITLDSFAALLTNNAALYNADSSESLCAWSYNNVNYPTHNYGTTATAVEVVAYGGGDGTSEESAYEISTADQLRLLASHVGDGHKFAGYYFKLTDNIDLGDVSFSGIGTSYALYFSGNFDGAGYEVSGLYHYTTSTIVYYNYKGLFGYVNNAVIKNLSVSGSIAGSYYIGGVVGYASYSTIENCHSSVEVKANVSYAGGVVGYATYSTIENCQSSSEAVTANTSYAGGIVGYLSSACEVNNCHSNVKVVTANGTSAYVGGVAGYISLSNNITNCSNTSDIQLMSSGFGVAGGIVGYSYNSSNTLLNCYNLGSVSATTTASSATPYLGGIMGHAAKQSTITNCYSAAAITVEEGVTEEYIGGVFGYSASTSTSYISKITNCYYDSDLFDGDGYGSLASESCNVITNLVGMSTDEMSASDFVDTLNANCGELTDDDLCPWVAGEPYPAFDSSYYSDNTTTTVTIVATLPNE